MQGTRRTFTPPNPGTSLRHNLMGLRFFSTPAPAGAEGGTPPAAPAAPTPTPPATPPATPVVTPPADDSPWNDPVAAQKEIERLRAENAKDRTAAKTTAAEDATKALTESIGKALGLIKDGDNAPDPAALTAQLADAATAAQASQRELAVFKTAATVPGADTQALLDSRAFMTAIKDIEPTDTAALKTAIEKALTDNPRLKVAQVAGKSGGDLTGGTGENSTKTPLSLDAAVKAALTQ